MTLTLFLTAAGRLGLQCQVLSVVCSAVLVGLIVTSPLAVEG